MEHVARVLDQHMLVAAAGAEKRPLTFARVPNGEERAVHVAVRASGNGLHLSKPAMRLAEVMSFEAHSGQTSTASWRASIAKASGMARCATTASLRPADSTRSSSSYVRA